MNVVKLTINTFMLGTSSRAQYIVVFDVLWRTPIVYHIVCNVPHWCWGSLSAVARSMPKKYLQTLIVSHTPQNAYHSCRGSLNTNPYRFPCNSKDISLMPRIFEPKPLSFCRNSNKNTNFHWIAHLSFPTTFAPIPVATPIVFHDSCSWGVISGYRLKKTLSFSSNRLILTVTAYRFTAKSNIWHHFLYQTPIVYQ